MKKFDKVVFYKQFNELLNKDDEVEDYTKTINEFYKLNCLLTGDYNFCTKDYKTFNINYNEIKELLEALKKNTKFKYKRYKKIDYNDYDYLFYNKEGNILSPLNLSKIYKFVNEIDTKTFTFDDYINKNSYIFFVQQNNIEDIFNITMEMNRNFYYSLFEYDINPDEDYLNLLKTTGIYITKEFICEDVLINECKKYFEKHVNNLVDSATILIEDLAKYGDKKINLLRIKNILIKLIAASNYLENKDDVIYLTKVLDEDLDLERTDVKSLIYTAKNIKDIV